MNNFLPDQFATFDTSESFSSAIGFAGLFVCVLIAIISFKLCTSWFGDASPGYVACFGWLLGICLANGALMFVLEVLMGQPSTVVMLPFVCFLTLYMTSCAAKCELFNSLVILMVHSMMTAFGTSVVLLALTLLHTGAVATGQTLESASGNTINGKLQSPQESTAPNPNGVRPGNTPTARTLRSKHLSVQGTEDNPFFQN